MHNVLELSFEAIKKEAQEAAFFHDDINAACPYPFGTITSVMFKQAFYAAKAAMAEAAQKTVQP